MKATSEAFRKYVSSLLPFTQQQQAEADKKMLQVMQKESKKGMLLFKPEMMPSPLESRAKKMQMPDEIRQKIAKAKIKRKIEL
jgi:hypothetical protein